MRSAAIVGLGMVCMAGPVGAADGTWTDGASGNWSDNSKWSDGVVAEGANAQAVFSSALAGDRTVTNDVDNRVVGRLRFLTAYVLWGGNAWWLTHPTHTLVLSTGGMGTPVLEYTGSHPDWGSANIDTRLGGTEGVDVKGVAGYTVPRPLYLWKANTYSGLTTVYSNAWLVTKHPRSLGSSDTVVVRGGGFLMLGSTSVDDANGTAVVLESGAMLSMEGGPGYPTLTLTGGVSVAGSVAIRSHGEPVHQFAELVLDASITESAPGSSVSYGNWPGGSYRGSLRLKRANHYTGGTTLRPTCVLYVDHPDAFGTNAETIVLRGDDSNYQDVELVLGATNATGALNPNKQLRIETNGVVFQGQGTLVSNTITMAGGTYRFGARVRGPLTNSSAILLSAGTISTVSRHWADYDAWYQVGTISGAGALLLTGGTYDEQLHFRGNNTYSGGTILENQGWPFYNFVGADHAFGTGWVDLRGPDTNTVMCALEANATMPNVFKGNGRVQTGAYTLTVTGGFAPGSAAAPLGALLIDKLKVGTDDRGATYIWSFTNGASDVVCADTLAFGKTTHTVQCEWLGQGVPPEGVHVLFAYAGADPDLSGVNWAVEGLGGSGGKVSLDAANKRVLVTIKRQGSMILVW